MRGADVEPTFVAPDIPGVVDLALIGRGGSGLIYRGRQGALARDVAVKVLATPSAATPAALDRWRRELEAMGRLSNHPNIVAVYDSGLTPDGRPYLVMPYIPAGSLGDRVRNDGPLGAHEAVGLGIKIASALTAAHHAGVLHRDVKPDNVLLSPYEPQLADFGIARLVDATTTAVTAIGQIHATINYAAPEVLAGEPASEASDVYGLGATLYTALRGEVPYPHAADANVIAVAHQIIHEPLPSLDGDVPAGVADAIEQAMAKDPAHRPQSAAALGDILESALTTGEAEPVAPTTTATERLDRIPTTPIIIATERPSVTRVTEPRASVRARRFSPLVALAGAVAVAAGALGVALASGNDDDADPPLSAVAPTGAVATTVAPAVTKAPRTPVSRAPATGDAAVAEAGRRYFTLLSRGDYGGAYGMLSPGFQAAQSQSSFERFWRSASPVSITGPVTARGLTVTVPIQMGSRANTFVLTLARAEGNTLVVDGPRPR